MERARQPGLAESFFASWRLCNNSMPVTALRRKTSRRQGHNRGETGREAWEQSGEMPRGKNQFYLQLLADVEPTFVWILLVNEKAKK